MRGLSLPLLAKERHPSSLIYVLLSVCFLFPVFGTVRLLWMAHRYGLVILRKIAGFDARYRILLDIFQILLVAQIAF